MTEILSFLMLEYFVWYVRFHDSFCDSNNSFIIFFFFAGKTNEASLLFSEMQEEGIKPGLVCSYSFPVSSYHDKMI